jgi:hypothetical protein
MVCHFVVWWGAMSSQWPVYIARFMAWLCGGGLLVSSHPTAVIGKKQKKLHFCLHNMQYAQNLGIFSRGGAWQFAVLAH